MADHIPHEIFEVYHRNKGEFISMLKAAVMIECPYDVLPEVFDVFGDDALKFVEIFSGRTISVPSVKDLVTKLRQVAVWVTLGSVEGDKQKFERMVDTAAGRFNMRKADVRQTYLHMQTLMDNLAMELRPKTNGKEGS